MNAFIFIKSPNQNTFIHYVLLCVMFLILVSALFTHPTTVLHFLLSFFVKQIVILDSYASDFNKRLIQGHIFSFNEIFVEHH